MATKRVLVTGASGFVGQPLVRALVDASYGVRAAARRPLPLPDAVDIAIVPDFSNPVDWDAILTGIDIVIHAAAHVHLGASNDGRDLGNRINFMTTYNLANAAARAGVERFLFISSVRAQCGVSSELVIREGDDVRPTNNYGRTKFAAELAIREAGVPFTILRPVVIYGPNPTGSIKLMARLASLPVPLPFNNLSSRRSLLSVDNLISAITFALNNPATIGETFLVADPKPFTVTELFLALRRLQGRQPLLFGIPPKLFKIALKLTHQAHLWDRVFGNLVVDTAKLESFGWRAPVETYNGLRALVSTKDSERLLEVAKGQPKVERF
jgi:nucleoside-diphosphate-sugar epimerase